MQERIRRSNAARSETTRQMLIDAARELFVHSGYADTGTPDIVEKAAVTRGALYHHFVDKAALFEAVIRQEAGQVAEAIAAATCEIGDPLESLAAGTEAYLAAMAVRGRTRLLLIDGPAVLGRDTIDRIDRENAAATLVEGLSAAANRPVDAALEALASLFSAAFDRAALDIAAGAAAAPYKQLLKDMLAQLTAILPRDGISSRSEL